MATFLLIYVFYPGNFNEKVDSVDFTVGVSVKVSDLIFKVYPEKRIPRENNWATYVDFKYKSSTGTIDYTTEGVQTNKYGVGTLTFGPTANLMYDRYGVYIKGISHLTRRYEPIELSTSLFFIDFTVFPYNINNNLLAGDTHRSRDDLINSLDLSWLLIHLSTDDYVNDLNQDGLVNSLDLSNLLYNLSKEGDV